MGAEDELGAGGEPERCLRRDKLDGVRGGFFDTKAIGGIKISTSNKISMITDTEYETPDAKSGNTKPHHELYYK